MRSWLRPLLFSSLLTLSWSSGFADIVEIQHLEELPSFLKEGALVLVDVDQTLIEPNTYLGSDNWWKGVKQTLALMQVSPERVANLEGSVGALIFSKLRYHPLEATTTQVIADMQNQGYAVLGCTARPAHWGAITSKGLKQAGIDFEAFSFLENKEQAGKSFHYSHAILFSSHRPKGPALAEFLEKNDIHPKSVVLVDDKLAHLKSVEESLASLNIPFTGLHYRYAESHPEPYDSVAAAIQLRSFLTGGGFLSNEQALTLKNAQPEKCLKDYLGLFFSWIAADIESARLAECSPSLKDSQ